MKLNIKLGKETSAQLAELIDKINNTKIGDLDTVKSELESKLNNLKPMIESIDGGDKLYEFLNNSINRQKDEIIFIDEDPNIIDNKKLVNIRTNKMDNKEKLMQEVDETLALLNKKQFSQLVVRYHEKLFSEISDLDGEDLEELKDKLNEIADRIEDVLENEEVEVTDDQVAEEEVVEETTEEVTEEPLAEGEEVVEDTSEEMVEEQPAEEVTEDVVEDEVKEESETEEVATEEVIEVAPEVVEMIEGIDAQIEELKEAVQTKDFSKVIARAYSRCFDAIEEHEDLIENIDELKESMNELADKLEEITGSTEEVTEEVKEESAKATCWEVFNKETGDATGDQGTFDEVGEIVQDLGPSFGIRPCGEKKFSKYAIYDRVSGQRTSDESDDPTELRDLLKNEYENPGQYEVRGFDAEEVVEVVDETPESEVSADDTIQAVAETAAEQAVADYMEGQLILGNENEEAATLTLTDEELAPRKAEVDNFDFIHDQESVIDTELTDCMSELNEEDFYNDELFLGEENKELCDTKKFSNTKNLDLGKEVNPFGSQVLSVENLLGFN